MAYIKCSINNNVTEVIPVASVYNVQFIEDASMDTSMISIYYGASTSIQNVVIEYESVSKGNSAYKRIMDVLSGKTQSVNLCPKPEKESKPDPEPPADTETEEVSDEPPEEEEETTE